MINLHHKCNYWWVEMKTFYFSSFYSKVKITVFSGDCQFNPQSIQNWRLVSFFKSHCTVRLFEAKGRLPLCSAQSGSNWSDLEYLRTTSSSEMYIYLCWPFSTAASLCKSKTGITVWNPMGLLGNILMQKWQQWSVAPSDGSLVFLIWFTEQINQP